MPRNSSGLGALEALFKADPDTFMKFIVAVASDLGIAMPSVSCPNCNSGLIVNLSLVTKQRAADTKESIRKGNLSGLMGLTVQLAALKSTMVGNIHLAFKKHLGAKAKTLTKEQYRELKERWLQSQISKEKRRRKNTAA